MTTAIHYLAGVGLLVGGLLVVTGVAGHKEYENDATDLLKQGIWIILASLAIGYAI